ncbi:MAG: FAD:protein FMN transferase [Coriobacteriales bacterium]|nr:FAD:protein FMN transferase [Coriobacteriales bacterium]
MKRLSENSQAGVDAVFTARMSRRAFCAMGLAAGSALFAGCVSTTQDQTNEAEKPSPSEEPQEESVPQEEETSTPQEAVKGSTFAYNTLVSLTAYGVDQSVIKDCIKAYADYEDLFSARKSGTDIDRINQAKGAPVEVDQQTADLIAEALEFCEKSEGAFDITIGSVSLLWDFMEAVKPDDALIQEAVKHIDYTQVKLDGTTVTLLDPEAKLDLGGIAKGWICGEIARKLKDAGATAGLIDLGTSSICAFGTKPDGSGWRIGLRDPREDATGYVGIIELTDISMTSSGLYEQQFELDGVTYWHILDSSTGYPAQTDMLGDTVVCADAAFGDAVTTMLFVKGIDEAVSWIEKNYPDVAAMFIPRDGEPVFVNGFSIL